ncbi:hypothetical protein NKG05_17645 [Oerskovia sp. M15]
MIGYFSSWRTGANGQPRYLASDIPGTSSRTSTTRSPTSVRTTRSRSTRRPRATRRPV